VINDILKEISQYIILYILL